MISVVVPVYNGAHVLSQTVPAMMAQTAPAEWIFVDDGSSDDSAALINRLVASGPGAAGATTRVLSLPANRGRAGARNAGIAAATGRVLVFLDADVAPVPRALEALSGALEQPGAVAAVGRFTWEEADERDPYQHYLASPLRGAPIIDRAEPLDWRYFLLGLAAIRAEALRQVGLLDESITYGEDLELACRLATHYPGGLRQVQEAKGRLLDLGDLDKALRTMREFGGKNLPRLVSMHPGLTTLIGLHHLEPETGLRSRLMHLVLREPLVLATQCVLPLLPKPLSDYAVRYLLGYTLVTSFRKASVTG